MFTDKAWDLLQNTKASKVSEGKEEARLARSS